MDEKTKKKKVVRKGTVQERICYKCTLDETHNPSGKYITTKQEWNGTKWNCQSKNHKGA